MNEKNEQNEDRSRIWEMKEGIGSNKKEEQKDEN